MSRQFGSSTAAGVVVAAVVTFSAAATTTRTQQSQPPKPETRESGTDLYVKNDTGRQRTGSALLNAFFHDSTSVDSSLRRKLDVIIATLPDPLDSHLDYEFDGDLAAIRQAFEASGYVTDRFWFPWPVDREKSEIAARINRIDTTSYRRHFPGVMLFRHVRDSSLRLLYIVGEVPTSGIHVQAFEQALADRSRVLRDKRVQSDTSVTRIVGPAFTGGAPSLGAALARRQGAAGASPDSIDVISGSATGDLASTLVKGHTKRVGYRSTLHSDAALERVERNVLCKRLKIGAARIAVLRESSTQYGAGRNGTPVDSKRKTNADGSDSCTGAFLDIPFPANISSVRTEYARAPGQLTGKGAENIAPRIQLDLQDPTREMENPVVMSRLTPAIVDAMLDQIARTLTAQRIRAVGIMATDSRDKIFLAAQLRRRMRDVTMFTTESNILLLRRDLNASLRGMLVFATYPLQLDAQRWDTAGVATRRFAFANDGAEGIFNATRLQLNDNARLAEYGVPDMGDAPLYCDYGFRRPDTSNTPDMIPPIWVLAIGRSAFYPLAACRTGNAQNLMPLRPLHSEPVAQLDKAAPSKGYALALIIIVAIGLFLIAVEDRHHRWLAAASTDVEAGGMSGLDRSLLVLQGHLYAILRIAAIGIVSVGLGIGVIHRLSNEEEQPLAFYLAVGVAGLMGVFLMVRHAVAAHRAARVVLDGLRYKNQTKEERRGSILCVADVVGRGLIVVIAAWFVLNAGRYVYDIVQLGKNSERRQELLLHRAGELAGGFSPAMILALTGAMFALWCTWHSNRIRLLLAPLTAFERASVARYAPPGVVASQTARWSRSMRNVRTHLLLLIPDRSALAFFVVFLALALTVSGTMFMSYEALVVPSYDQRLEFMRRLIRSGTHFDFLMRFGLTTGLAATGWAIFRISRIWTDLRRTLGKLGRTPQVTAFERLPRRIARLTHLNIIRPHAEALVLSISAAQATHLRRLYATLTLSDKRALTNSLDDIPRTDGTTLSAAKYLDQLMSANPATSPAWRAKHWRSEKEWIGVQPDDERRRYAVDQSALRSWERQEEAMAVRFLFDLTEHAHALEPTAKDVEFILTKKPDTSASESGAPKSSSGQIRRTFSNSARLWIRTVEELLAVQVVDYIQWVIQYLRQLTFYIVASLLILTEMLISYVLQPASQLWLILIVLVLASTVVLVTIVLQMNRDEVLSRIEGTTPGVLTWDMPLLINLSIIVIVPLITFVGSILPWLHDGLFSWLDPLLKGLGRH